MFFFLSQEFRIIVTWFLWTCFWFYFNYRAVDWINLIWFLWLYTLVSIRVFFDIGRDVYWNYWPIFLIIIQTIPIYAFARIEYKKFIYQMTEYNFFYRHIAALLFVFWVQWGWELSLFAIVSGIILVFNMIYLVSKKVLTKKLVIYYYILTLILAIYVFTHVFFWDYNALIALETYWIQDFFAALLFGNLFVYIVTKLVVLFLLIPFPERRSSYEDIVRRIENMLQAMYDDYNQDFQWSYFAYLLLILCAIFVYYMASLYALSISYQLLLYRLLWSICLFFLKNKHWND